MHMIDPIFPNLKEKTTKVRRHQTFNNRIRSQQSNFAKSHQLASLPFPLAPDYPGDIWTEVGPEGSVCRITGYDVSLHVEVDDRDQDSDHLKSTFINGSLSRSTSDRSPSTGVKKHRKVLLSFAYRNCFSMQKQK